MLAITPLRSHNGAGEETGAEMLLDDISINFDDILVGFDDGDILPDLEIDPDDIFADFSFSSGEEESGNTAAAAGDVAAVVPERDDRDLSLNEVVSCRSKDDQEEDGSVTAAAAEKSAGNRSGRKSPTAAGASKGSHGKKKAKVDWTPELHRRFVQAVEQLGVDKAVPSRILELMGIDCLTRHNIASHLQKYRSHRKHLLAREAEAASWSQRRQMYAGGGVMKRPVDMKNPNWQAAPIAGFPPPHQVQMQPLIRPLHVWGHPSTADRPQLVPVWPRHLTPPPPWLSSRPHLGPPPPMPDPSYWHPHYQRALTQGMPCFPPQLVPAARFQAPPVPGVPQSHPLFRPVPSHNAAAAAAAAAAGTLQVPSSKHSTGFDAHPSNESIDAAIGDVLAKPWSPLPLGLKPPSLESVMVELQRQGVSKVPPTTSTSSSC